MHIKEATIHQLIKAVQTKGDGSVTRHVRTASLPIDSTLQQVSSDLLSMYGNRSNSTGTFGLDPTIHQFPVKLREYLAETSAFQDFSVSALTLIEHEMEKSLLASGGFALFLRYTQGGSDFLLVAMLKLKPGAGINETTLDLQPTLNIDLNLLHEAARINLTRFQKDEQPYLSFIKGKSAAGDVTEYFRAALACMNFTSSKHHTEQVIAIADAFVDARQDLTSDDDRREEKASMRARLYDCFVSNSTEVVLQTIAAAVMPSDPQNFIDFVKDEVAAERYHISDTFQPDKKVYKGLRRIRGTIGKTVVLSFSVDDVRESRVAYDSNTDSIVLASPPEKLKQAILENVAVS
ncbi:nucleoid-associated protein [Lysobacter soli]|uniref:nucleoid-associated protein n=1 Tax=Lysobacter soli TaxID=453783 RepID=UPI0037C54663